MALRIGVTMLRARCSGVRAGVASGSYKARPHTPSADRTSSTHRAADHSRANSTLRPSPRIDDHRRSDTGPHSYARWPLPEIDLRAAGLWGRRVALIEPFDAPCGTPVGAGETGIIGWTEPATFKMCDLKVAAPVDALPVASGGTVAVPWRLVKLIA